ncbi:type IV secretion system protein VirB10 [Agrobacterium vitis]|uniref:Type IV secretion system protein VirB10 n=1 Tax=Agrobacterium vitis TaxID=373 RepID=A0ABD6GDF4_AGRVI|nr:type IV secretion system protein VirB10 [Agrobacterium vitis]ASK46345.1 type IV secretion system protein VirB10 [Agrobacterium vitis]MUO81349.1 type IV secretion system protein VirB10 [Agrobacterium vitis]MUO96278.1 type IV secretion system protein VirB10 [Agrobacterium vitis]MUP06936.1 type IV secretion system protein VirB10 [Agrobacterium vitis]MUZ84844.1 type IV secretion system protein VirB10 [Agrobacterium vitis]
MNEVNSQPGAAIDASASLVSDPHRRRLSGSQKLVVAGLVLVLSLGLIWLGARPKKKTEPSPPDTMIDANTKPFRPTPIDIPSNPTASQPTTEATSPPDQHQREHNEVRPEETPIFAYSGSDQSDKPTRNADIHSDGEDNRKSSSLPESEASAENDLSIRMNPTVLEPSRAALLPHPDFTVTQGTIIPCILQTAIDTNLAGYVKCVLPGDIRGATGNVVLLDRGTTVVGEIQHGLQQGDARVFVLWNRAETPAHAVVSLFSPGADELGRSGLPGTVDNHFWKRFGGAMLLSVVQGAVQAASHYAGSSDGGTSFNSFQNNGEQAADTALRATINIPPTLKKNQGDTVSIFVARDLDFSDIYQLHITGGLAKSWHRR